MNKSFPQAALLLAITVVIGIIAGATAFFVLGLTTNSILQILVIGLIVAVSTIATILMVIFILGPVVAPDLLLSLAEVLLKRYPEYLSDEQVRSNLETRLLGFVITNLSSRANPNALPGHVETLLKISQNNLSNEEERRKLAAQWLDVAVSTFGGIAAPTDLTRHAQTLLERAQAGVSNAEEKRNLANRWLAGIITTFSSTAGLTTLPDHAESLLARSRDGFSSETEKRNLASKWLKLVIHAFSSIAPVEVLPELADKLQERLPKKSDSASFSPDMDFDFIARLGDWDRLSEGKTKSNIEGLCDLKPADDDAELWVIASGKGGVGKSVISLGLLEKLSTGGKVLLLDFDLHNCGLTSLLKLRQTEGEKVSAYSLLNEFVEMLELDKRPEKVNELMTMIYKTALPPGFAMNYQHIVNKFSLNSRLQNEDWGMTSATHPIKISRIPQKPPFRKRIPVKNTDDPNESPLIPANAFVMPSRRANEQLLLGRVSEMSYILVYLFLRSLCYWLKGYTIILDCHGAHDAFTAASILAARKLVVVSTPDPGAFDGTMELLETIHTSNELGRINPEDTVIVFNNCSPVNMMLKEKLQKAVADLKEKKSLKFQNPVFIDDDPMLREKMKVYEFGDISANPQLWKKIHQINDQLVSDAGESDSPSQKEKEKKADSKATGKTPGKVSDKGYDTNVGM